MKNTSKKRRLKKGGKAIASGGYGCVFFPALKCKNTGKQTLRRTRVSKLMIKKDAMTEYNELVKYKPILQTIPHYNDYFMIDKIDLCKPEELTTEDLKDYDVKCKPLIEDGFTSYNINGNIHQLYSINMPYGGIELGKYIHEITQKKEFIEINNTLVSLLMNGIKPMNEKNVFNMDVKDSNILVDHNEKGKRTARIIDWGLSLKATEGRIPDAIENRPIQFNLPFSLILYNKVFTKMYDEFLSKNPNPDYESIRLFVYNYVYQWFKIRGLGHMTAVDKIFLALYGNQLEDMDKESKVLTIEFGASYYYIVNYLTTVLNHYTKNGKLNLMEYTHKVFLKISDIWGFMVCYLQIYELLHYSYTSPQNELICDEIKRLLMEYLYKPRVEAIDIKKLEKELLALNHLFEKMEWSDHARKVSAKNMRAGFHVRKTKKERKTKAKAKTHRISKWIRGGVHLNIIHKKGINTDTPTHLSSQ